MKREITYREKYDPAMAITDQTEADRYFEELVAHAMSFGVDREEAERIERTNLGYWAGYYDHATRLRVEELFRCEHPIFGPAKNGPPDPRDALIAGLKLGVDLRDKRDAENERRRRRGLR